jgi:Tfp pilus assembly protein FimT
MAAYLPPLENLPIFNSEIFLDGTDLLDINTANKLYLRFPYAQGTQNMLDVNMSGTITFPSSGNTLDAQGWTGNVNSTITSLNSPYYLTFADSSSSGTGPLLKNQNFNINPNTNEIAIGSSLKVSSAATKKILIGTSAGATNQGNNSIAIGGLAGQNTQGSESLCYRITGRTGSTRS